MCRMGNYFMHTIIRCPMGLMRACSVILLGAQGLRPGAKGKGPVLDTFESIAGNSCDCELICIRGVVRIAEVGNAASVLTVDPNP